MFRDFVYLLGAAGVYIVAGGLIAIAQQPPPPPGPPTPVVAGIVAGAPVTGCAAQSVLFVKSTLGLGCNIGFTENDAGTQILVPSGTVGNPGISNAADTTTGLLLSSGFIEGVTGANSAFVVSQANGFRLGSTILGQGGIGWVNGAANLNAMDTGWRRYAAGVSEFNSGLSCATSSANCAEVIARSYIYGGVLPTVGGSCGSFGTPIGGNTNGTISSAAICAAASTITLTFAFTAPNGWNCQIIDRTTATAVIRETGTTQTVITFTVGVATAANDVLQFGPCGAY